MPNTSPQPIRSIADALATVQRLALPEATLYALTQLVTHPGPGTWHRVARLPLTPRARCEDVWHAIAPMVSRRTRPQDWMRAQVRGRLPEPTVREAQDTPRAFGDVFRLVEQIAVIVPLAPPSAEPSGGMTL